MFLLVPGKPSRPDLLGVQMMHLRSTKPTLTWKCDFDQRIWATEPVGVWLSRGAKSGGTREPGSQKVNQPAENILSQQEEIVEMFLQTKIFIYIVNCSHNVSADNDFSRNH